ncbi:unnamed protein product [Gongylonema pulchrum]|uniref:S1 motif domain-containing protein n=1 Tax=Gongylonema pulchrum TaxID=637853 RepID=A0A183D7Y2_9BILA|nr:unnamed protein product [Gongylonema pulchrum]
MKSSKLKETKKKQSLMNYPQTYMQGSLIPVFVCKGPHIGVVRVEASPLWNGVIRKQNLRDENLACFFPFIGSRKSTREVVMSKWLFFLDLSLDFRIGRSLLSNPTDQTSALIDIDFEPGEKLIARVIGVNVTKKRRPKSRHRKCLELSLVETKRVWIFENFRSL